MIQGITKTWITLMAIFAILFVVTLSVAPANAAVDIDRYAKCGSNVSKGCSADPGSPDYDVSAGKTTINKTIANIINVFSYIVGTIAVIMLIYGGFRYVTSGGDSGAISSAKNTILYAIVGLVIVAISQAIVWFVLGEVVPPPPPPTP